MQQKTITKTTKTMKIRTILSLMLALACIAASGKKKVTKQQLWPDGTPISEWFSDTTRVDLSGLKHYVVTNYGVNGYSSEVQTAALQAVIDRAAAEGGGSSSFRVARSSAAPCSSDLAHT